LKLFVVAVDRAFCQSLLEQVFAATQRLLLLAPPLFFVSAVTFYLALINSRNVKKLSAST
jgi:hypothetical protein